MATVVGGAKRGDNLFLTRALEKILSERETRRSQHAKLRKACEAALRESPVVNSGAVCHTSG